MGVRGIYKRTSSGKRYLARTIKTDSSGRKHYTSYTSRGGRIVQSQEKAKAEAEARIKELAVQKEKIKQETIQKEIKVKEQAKKEKLQTQQALKLSNEAQFSSQYHNPETLTINKLKEITTKVKEERFKEVRERFKTNDIQPADKIPFVERITGKSELKQAKGETSFVEGGILLGAGVISPVIDLGKMILHPIQTVKGLGTAIIHPIQTVQTVTSSFEENLKRKPEFILGAIAGDIALGVGVSKVSQKALQFASDVKVKYFEGKAPIPEEQIFSSQVLEGKSKVPIAKTSQEVKELFESSEGLVVHTTPNKFKEVPVGKGRKGQFYLEDAGIYTTPAGEGSPAFFKIDQPTDFKFSLLPKIKPTRPTLVEFQTKGLAVIPEEVLRTKGFKAVSEYAEDFISTEGKVYITKRSMIGRGELPKQKFIVEEDFISPFSERTIPKGTELVEGATPEIELVIPASSRISIDPNAPKRYTTYNGRVVDIQRYDVLGIKQVDDLTPIAKLQLAKDKLEFQKGQSAFSELYYGDASTTRISPSYMSLIPTSEVSITQSIPITSTPSTPSTLTFSTTDISPAPSRPTPILYPTRTLVVKPSEVSIVRSTGGSSGGSGGGSSGGSGGGSSGGSGGGSSGGSGGSSGGSIIPPEYIPTPISIIPSLRFENKKENNLFDVEIRKGGVWGRATVKQLTKEQALDFGAYAVDTTPQASFRITKRSTRKMIPVFSNIDVKAVKGEFKKRKSQFYKKGDIHIESRSFRISTHGEIKGLKKAKREKKGFKLW